MSTLIKGQVAVMGLAMMLSGPVFGQADSGNAPSTGKHIHFTDVNVRDNNDGKHKTYTIRATDADGNTYQMRKSDDRIVELEVNGRQVPKDEYAHYDALLGHLEQPPVPPVPPVPPAAPAPAAAPMAPAVPVAPTPAMAVTSAAPVAPAASPAVPVPPASPLPPTPPAPPEPPRANKYISHIIDDLINKGIITDETKLTFLLDDEQLTVNGVKQPDEVFETFKQKYIKHAGDHFRYERQGSSTITNIKIDDGAH